MSEAEAIATQDQTPQNVGSATELKEPIGNVQMFGRDNMFVMAKTRNTKTNGPKARVLVKAEQYRKNDRKELVVNETWIEMTADQADLLSELLATGSKTSKKLEDQATGSP